ncbi:MAG: energy transducer TonB [Blastocatellia bacterium]|nr:energy transducer TonB [Blastocatellia bacterium]
MFENLFESAKPKAVVQRHWRIFAFISMLWVVTFFTTLVEEVCLPNPELHEPLICCSWVSPPPPPLRPEYGPIPVERFICPEVPQGICSEMPTDMPDESDLTTLEPVVKSSKWFERNAIPSDYPRLGYKYLGTFKIDLLISEDGKVISATLVTGSPWGNFVRQTISKWRFKPCRVNGKPVPVVGRFVIEFTL